MEECTHSEVKEDVCTLCGAEQHMALLPSYTPWLHSHTGKMRYAITDCSRRYDARLSSILGMLGARGHESEIRKLLLTKEYRSRLSMNDKVLSAVFYTLRRKAHPIDYQDIMPYTHRTKKEFMRVVMREYGFSGADEEYLGNLFMRVKEHLRTVGFKKNVDFEEFKGLVRAHRSFSPHAMCIALHMKGENVEGCHGRLGLDRFCSISTLKRATDKIRNKLRLT
jgi:hypothetical protein